MKNRIHLVITAALLSLATLSRAADPQPAITAKAQNFPLSAVRLLDSPFKQAQETDKAYLLRLDADRLLAGFRAEAGLPKKANPYGGWEAIANSRYTMAGHTLGHYLSALSMMAASTGDADCLKRASYIVDELAACQKATGGILCAFPQSKQLFDEIAAGKIQSDHLFTLNGGYVPLYCMHKVMAGLRDAYVLLGNQTARDVLVRKTDWLAGVFSKLTDDQIQDVLETEQGGIMEVVADVYVITGDAKYLALAKRLNHKKFFDPLVAARDQLNGVHANASIPKVIGMERLYELTGDKDYGAAARFFWTDVVDTRSFVIGGHGSNEFFFAPAAFPTTGITSITGPETCNTYNMIKLSRQLWLVDPSVKAADFIERGLYNHILGSQDPVNGGFVYFTSLRPGQYRIYSSDTEDFWCCTGTGMENHAKYGSFIYAHDKNTLWLDLLIPSELTWAEQNVSIKLETRFPEEDKAHLTITAKDPKKFALSIRYPGWLKPGAMKLSVNGEPQTITAAPGSYATVERTWKTGDTVDIQWPLEIHTEFLPGSKEWVALLYGPVVLAGELGTAGLQDADFNNNRNYQPTKSIRPNAVPTFTGPADAIAPKIKATADKPTVFHTEGLAIPNEVTLEPFYRVHHQRYAIYWRIN